MKALSGTATAHEPRRPPSPSRRGRGRARRRARRDLRLRPARLPRPSRARASRRSCSATRSSAGSTATRTRSIRSSACGTCERCLAGEDNLCASWQLIGMHRAGRLRRAGRRPAAVARASCRRGSTRSAQCWPSRSPAASARSRRIRSATESSLAVFGCGPIGLLARPSRRPGRRARDGGRSAAGAPRDRARRSARPRRSRTSASSSPAQPRSPSTPPASSRPGAARSTPFGTAARSSCSASGSAEGTFPMAVLVRRAIALRGQFAYIARRLRARGRDPGRGRPRPRLALVGRRSPTGARPSPTWSTGRRSTRRSSSTLHDRPRPEGGSMSNQECAERLGGAVRLAEPEDHLRRPELRRSHQRVRLRAAEGARSCSASSRTRSAATATRSCCRPGSVTSTPRPSSRVVIGAVASPRARSSRCPT